MKKVTTVLSCLLFALIILFPAGICVSACFGYTFELVSIPAFAIITAILSVCTVVFSIVSEEAIKNKTINVLLAIITLLSLFNAVFYIAECSIESSTIVVIISCVVSVGCCCFLTVKHGKPLALKVTILVLSALLILPLGFFSFIALIFGNIGKDTVVQTVESPSGKYYAEVIASDQGALGGDTFVDVYKKKSGINFIIFKIKKMPQRVYSGKWCEFENMKIYWKDEQRLAINYVEYKIK